jgi:hypothetical protein
MPVPRGQEQAHDDDQWLKTWFGNCGGRRQVFFIKLLARDDAATVVVTYEALGAEAVGTQSGTVPPALVRPVRATEPVLEG